MDEILSYDGTYGTESNYYDMKVELWGVSWEFKVKGFFVFAIGLFI